MGIDMRLLSRRRVVSQEAGADSGEVSLNKLGYKQELSRGFGFVNNAAMSFRYLHVCCFPSARNVHQTCYARSRTRGVDVLTGLTVAGGTAPLPRAYLVFVLVMLAPHNAGR